MSVEKEELDKIQRSAVNGVRLKGVSEVVVLDTSFTPQDVESDRAKWAGYALMPGTGKKNLEKSDNELARELLHESVPVEIIGKTENGKETVLKIQLQRFPYSINGYQTFQSFGMRVFPISGEIEQVTLNHRRTIAINKQSIKPDESLTMDLGDGKLRLDISFKVPKMELPPLQPPTGFQESVITIQR